MGHIPTQFPGTTANRAVGLAEGGTRRPEPMLGRAGQITSTLPRCKHLQRRHLQGASFFSRNIDGLICRWEVNTPIV